MATTLCPTDTQLMPAALEEPAPADLQAHLDHCPECRRRVGRLRVEIQALRAAPSDRGGTTVPAGEAALSPEPYPVLIGGKYRVVGPLGRGGQGLVYRAVHLELQQDVAIKLACKPLRHDLVEDEGRLLANLRHPNLVQVHDLGLHEGRPYLVMEFVPGRTLEQLAEEQRLTPRRAAELVAAVARAVDYLHGRGVVHQDLKPRNILVGEDGRPRLIDFGLARLRDAWAGDADGPSGGTLAYMAPEQARGEQGRVGPASDVFALGGVLYFLLTRHAPFGREDASTVLDRARRNAFDRAALHAPGIPRRLARIVLRALATEPERRPDAAALARELERFAAGPRQRRCVAAVLVGLGSLALLWRDRLMPLTDGGASVVAPALRIEAMEIQQHRPGRGLLGRIGADTQAGQVEDEVRVSARLNAPAYCYLIALHPNGQTQLYYPEDATRPPPRTAALSYPLQPELVSPLTDGVGLQGYVLVASRRPLPPYATWRAHLGALPWQSTGVAEGVWRYDGRAFDRLGGRERSAPRPASDLAPPPFVATCRTLAADTAVEAIQAWAFPVRPASRSGPPHQIPRERRWP